MSEDSNVKKKNAKSSIAGAVFMCIFFLVILIVLIIIEKDVLLDNYVDFYKKERTTGIEKDDFVKIRATAALGNYAHTKHYTSFVPTGTERYYILWIGDNKVISVTVKDTKDVERLDKLSNQTWEYINSNGAVNNITPITLKGVVKTIDPKIDDYYDNYLSKINFNAEDKKVYHVTIDTTDNKNTAIGYIVFLLILDGVSWFILIAEIRKKKSEEFKKLAASMYKKAQEESVLEDNVAFIESEDGGEKIANPYGDDAGVLAPRSNSLANETANNTNDTNITEYIDLTYTNEVDEAKLSSMHFKILRSNKQLVGCTVLAAIFIAFFIGSYWQDIYLHFNGGHEFKLGFPGAVSLIAFASVIIVLIASVIYIAVRPLPMIDGLTFVYKNQSYKYTQIDYIKIVSNQYGPIGAKVFANGKYVVTVDRSCGNYNRFLRWAEICKKLR